MHILSQSPITWVTWLLTKLFRAGRWQWNSHGQTQFFQLDFSPWCAVGPLQPLEKGTFREVSQLYLRFKSKAWHFQRVNQILAGLNHSLELPINLTSWLSATVVLLNCIQSSFFWAWLVPLLIKTSSTKFCISPFFFFFSFPLTQSLLWIAWLCISHHKFLVL